MFFISGLLFKNRYDNCTNDADERTNDADKCTNDADKCTNDADIFLYDKHKNQGNYNN
jgi:hypothetical protein